MIDITLRGLNAAQLAALATVLASQGYAVTNADGDTRFANGEPHAGPQTSAPKDTAFYERQMPQVTPTGATFTPDYSDQLAASVFGGGGLQVAATLPNVPPATQPLGHQAPAAPVAAVTTQSPPLQPHVASAASGTQGGAVVLDSKGRPWDGRIHGSGKTFLAKGGEWKLIRGVDPQLVLQVNAELDAHKHHVHSGQPLAAEVTPVVTRFNDVVIVPPATYTPPAAYTPVIADELALLRDKILGAVAAKRIVPTVVGQMLNHFGIASIEDLSNHQAKWATVSSEIDRLAGAA